MTRAQSDQIAKILHRVLLDLDGSLPTIDIENARSYVDAGEPGVALENLCTQLAEYEVAIPQAVLDQIAAAGEAMELEPGYWADLAVRDP